MSLFGKKNAEEQKACCNGTGAIAAETERTAEITGIAVLGGGCKSCHKLYENAKKAVEELGLSVTVEYITDLEKVMEYGVMSMPALAVNGKAVSMGKVLKPDEIKVLLR